MNQDAIRAARASDANRVMARPSAGRTIPFAALGSPIDFLKTVGLLGLATIIAAAVLNSTHGRMEEAALHLGSCGGQGPVYFALRNTRKQSMPFTSTVTDETASDCMS